MARFSIGSDRRSVSWLFAAAVLAVSSPGCSGEQSGEGTTRQPARLTILYSSDLVGKIRSCGCTEDDSGGLGRRATYTKEVRDGAEDLIVLDAGDAFSLDLAYTKDEAIVTLESFSLMGVDVFTPGENEFIFGLPFLQGAVENASFSTVAANIVDPESGTPVFGDEYVIRELAGGIRLAVTGVIDESIRFPSYIDRTLFRVEPAAPTLRRLLPRMRREADFLILLSHFDLERTRELLAEVQGFDIAVIGHGKPLMKKTETVGKTLLLGTGGLGRYLGRIDLRLSAAGTMEYGRLQIIPLEEKIPLDPGIVELFRVYRLPLTDKGAGGH